MNIRW